MTRGASWRGRKLQPSLTLHCKELLLCGPTRVHLRGRLGEKELEIRMSEVGGRKQGGERGRKMAVREQ